MLNIIKADLFRIFRGKGIYVTIIIFLFIIVMQTLLGHLGQIGIFGTAPDEIPEPFTGYSAPFEVANTTDNLIWFTLPIIVFIAAADFTGGAMKNSFAGGVGRVEYYFAKLVLSGISLVIMLMLYITLPIIIASAVYGFGGEFNLMFIGSILKICLPQFLLAFVFVSVGIFLSLTFKKSAILCVIYFAFAFYPVIIAQMLISKFPNLLNYDLISNMKAHASPGGIFGEPDIIRTILLSCGFILTSIIGGILLFRKAEIK